MPVLYNSNQMIPAPQVTIRREQVAAEDGTPLSATYNITLRGKIFAYKGSPKSDGTWWTSGGGTYPPDESPASYQRLTYILRKQEALIRLFQTEGLTLEIMPIYPDASPSLKCYPRLKGEIQFDPGMWFEYCDYTINLEADNLYGANGAFETDPSVPSASFVVRTSEEWGLEAADDIGRTYRLTHTLSATGRRIFSTAGDGSLRKSNSTTIQAWQNAQAWVFSRLGIDTSRLNPTINSGPSAGGSMANYANLSAYNFLRAEHVNEMAGTYSVTETWLCIDLSSAPSPGSTSVPAIEDFTLNTRIDEAGRLHANVEGTIKGLELRNNTSHTSISSRYTNALAYWATVEGGLYARVMGMLAAGTPTLHPTPLSITQTANEVTGVITYNYEFNNRPLSLVANSIFESININIENPVDLMAQIAVPGRKLGPVIQDMQTNKVGTKTVTLTVQMKSANYDTGPNPSSPNTDAIILTFAPVGVATFYLDKDVPNWEPTSGKYTRTATWIFES